MDFHIFSYEFWIALCLLLMIVEMGGAGGYLLWAGMAAGATSLTVFFFPALAWQAQLVVFSIASIVSAVGWWRYQSRRQDAAKEPLLNRRDAQCIGRIAVLTDAIENGRGRVRLDDSFWNVAAAEDMPVGQSVKVLSVQQDNVLFVARV